MKVWKGYQKGVNLGGWLSQCNHTKERYDNFIKEEDIKLLSSWGLDHLRVPVDYDLVEDEKGDYKEAGFGYLEKIIDWCGRYNLNLVLDLHKTYGYSFDDGEGESVFFFNEQYQQRFYRLWEEFARRFGSFYERVAFELLNEVTAKDYCDTWNRVADTCIAKIRAIAPEITILVGGYWNNSVEAVKDIKLSNYDNIILNFHCYEPFSFTHQGASWVSFMPKDFRMKFPATKAEFIESMKISFPDGIDAFTHAMKDCDVVDGRYFESLFAEAISVAEKIGAPLYCGEYGAINLADAESTLHWYETIEPIFVRHGIGRAAWSYKQMDFGLIDEHMKPVIDDVIKLLIS